MERDRDQEIERWRVPIPVQSFLHSLPEEGGEGSLLLIFPSVDGCP